jgi:hypothetical protein
MIPKPNFLTGKVEPFIGVIYTWNNVTSATYPPHLESFNDKAHYTNQIIKDFYDQNFEPGMITELFEGWFKKETNKDDADTVYTKTDKTVIIIFIGIRMNILRRDKFIDSTVLMPKTLNDFISDCKRIGVRLTWRK